MLAFAAESATVVSDLAVSAVVASSEVWEAMAAWDLAISFSSGTGS